MTGLPQHRHAFTAAAGDRLLDGGRAARAVAAGPGSAATSRPTAPGTALFSG